MSETRTYRQDRDLAALELAAMRLRAIVLQQCGDKAPSVWAQFDAAIRAARAVILEA